MENLAKDVLQNYLLALLLWVGKSSYIVYGTLKIYFNAHFKNKQESLQSVIHEMHS